MKSSLLFLTAAAAAAALITPRVTQPDQTVISIEKNEDHPATNWWDSLTQGNGFQALADSFEDAVKDAHDKIVQIFEEGGVPQS